MRRLVTAPAVLLGATLVTPAHASYCDLLDLQFDPSKLQRCIDELKSAQQDQGFSNEMAVRTIELQLCTLELQIARINPSVADEETLKSFCPKLGKPKRKAPAQAPNPNRQKPPS
jgi:hypothetical protein